MRAKQGLFPRRACGKLPPLWFGRAPRERGSFFASCLRKPPPFRLGGPGGGLPPRRACGKPPSFRFGWGSRAEACSALRLRKSRLSRRFLFGMRAKQGLFPRRACGKLPSLWFGRAPRERGPFFATCLRKTAAPLVWAGAARAGGPSFALRLRKIAALPVWVGCPGRGLLSRCACGKRNPSGLGGVTGRAGAFFRVAPVKNCRPSGLGGCRANGSLFRRCACGKPLAFRLGWGVTGRAGISRAAALFPIVWGQFWVAWGAASGRLWPKHEFLMYTLDNPSRGCYLYTID